MVQSNTMFLRSYVRTEEYDLTQTISANSGTIPYIQGEFERGPLEPIYNGPSTFYNKYGERATPNLSFAWDTAACVIKATSNVLVKRLVNEAKHAGLDVVLDDDVTYGKRVLLVPFVEGLENGYDKSGKLNTSGVSTLKFSASFATGQTFTISITDGTTVTPVSVAYTTDNNTTLAAIATAITDAIKAFSPSLEGSATTLVETTSPVAPRHTILLRKPNDATIEFIDPAVTGTSAPTVTLKEASDTWLFSVVAENPGEWAQAYGAKIAGIDAGIRARYRIAFSGPLVTGNSVVVNLNGVDLTTVPFNTDSDTTMADIAALLEDQPSILSATVENVAGATNNDRSILVVANNPGPDSLAFVNPVVTGGTSQPTAIVSNVLKGIASSGALTLQIFNSENVNSAAETFSFTLFPQTNGKGDQIYFDTIVNQGGKASINVRVIGNPALATAANFAAAKTFLLDTATTFRSTISWMEGGDNGLTVNSGQLIQSLDAVTDRIRYPMNLVLSAGYTDTSYLQAIDVLCEGRGDCTGIFDMPVAKQAAQDAYNFRMFELNIDSSYSAIYSPQCQITDISTGEDRYIPPSGPVAAMYIYNDSVRNRYAAPAGLNRGPLRQVKGLLYEYTPGDLELMNPVGINTIVNKTATGPTVMSEETLQFANSALSSIHIRRTLNDIKTTLADGLEYTLFEPNSESTRFNVVQLAESVLAPAVRNEGLYDYYVKCDEENNTGDVIDQDILIVDIYVKPVRVAKGIILRSFITRTSISFQEVVASFTL